MTNKMTLLLATLTYDGAAASDTVQTVITLQNMSIGTHVSHSHLINIKQFVILEVINQ